MKSRYAIFFFLILSLSALLLSSCKDIDLTPAFCEITPEDVENCMDVSNFNDNHEMSYDNAQLSVISSLSFKDFWIYLDGTNLGCWEVPCRIPVLPNYSDTSTLYIYPAVRLNGLSTTLPLYPFVKPYTRKILFDREEVYTFEDEPIRFEYVNEVVFPMVETFDQSAPFSSVDTIGGTPMTVTEIDGRTVGHVALLDSNSQYFDLQTPYCILPCRGTSCFWEMDFKCDNEITAELAFLTTSNTIRYEPLVVLRETDGEWKRICINLTQVLATNSPSTGDMYARLMIHSAQKNDKPTHFYFDNLRIITYKTN